MATGQDPQNTEGEATGEELPAPTFPDIGEPEPESQPSGEEQSAEATQAEQDRLAQLEQRFQQLEQSYQERERQYQQTIDRLIAGQTAQAGQQQAAPQQPQGPRIDDLPDPVDSPQQFRTKLQEFIDSQVQSRTQAVQSEQSQQAQLNNLVNSFWQENSDLQGFNEIVDGAWNREAQRLRQQGVDPNQALLVDPDGMKRRVADAARQRMSELGIQVQQSGQQATGTDGAAAGNPQQQRPNRTAGVAGGSMQTARGSGGGDKVVSFVDQIAAKQEKEGLL